ncbi:MAG TPA: tRNA (adenosine(37)-N6)-threonylcarbamoyltransferase complex dimerization subunit type 1 TsaB [Candidatus Cybelea sp.]|jgi:tRNA threonylcarbamoyladenosine biosynthesis protein TsaB|nr:tRNA (adenosine(37)-N6)-threonylcarbamoyltransferase complex dimerization subunit type 1 TsaB [Candidatus Cybelea sp.]
MNVLAVDGALGSFSAAIAQDDRVVAARSEAGNVALERGLALVEAVLEQAGLAPPGLDRLAVGIGPGTFTGLRIAIAYAKSLAAVWQRPLVPILSFDLLEFGNALDRVLTIVEGRPGVISARYRCDSETRRASGRIADVLDALVVDKGGKLSVIGAPKDVLHALAERGIIVRPVAPLVMPAAAAAALAASARTPPKSLHEVHADYGELPAVTMRKR